MVRSVLRSLAGAALVAAACTPSPVPTSGTCTFTSDCEAPQLCLYGTCRSPCAETRDCPAGQQCIGVDGGDVCELPQEIVEGGGLEGGAGTDASGDAADAGG